MMMKADDLEKYADLMVESFNKALELREASLLKRISELEARAPVSGPAGKDGADGKDADEEAIYVKTADYAASYIREKVAELPKPKDGADGLNGKDAEPIDVKALAANVEIVVIPKVLAAIPEPVPGSPGKDGKDGLTIKGDPGEPGTAGKDGINGKDAPPVDTKALGDEIVQKVLGQIPHGKDGADGKSVDIEAVQALVSGEVIKAVSALPTALPGRDGIPGADGANGLNGKDGRDGFSLKDFSCEPLDDGRTIRLKFSGQDSEVIEELTLPIPVYREVYQRENRDLYQKHDWLTYGNETWAVMVDKPTSDPGMDRGEWQLVARKGRDGRDRDRAKDHNGPVKL